jgi:pimeloyl-ACP methyl ester carboxylesterase
MRSLSSLYALLAAIVVTAEALRGITSTTALSASGPVQAPALQDLRHVFYSGLVYFNGLIHERYHRIVQGQVHHLDMVQLLVACSIIHGIRLWRRQLRERSEIRDEASGDRKSAREWGLSAGSQLGISSAILSAVGFPRVKAYNMHEIDADLSDPGLLQKHSTFKSYTTSTATYPSIRTFYRPHSQADKLPSEPTPLPLLVFVHGLGGSLAQFNPLLTSLVNVGPCLGVDLPGCGRSAFSPTTWNAYTPKALAELLCVVIAEHCEQHKSQGVILIGHSAGCSYSVLVAQAQQGAEVLALVGICPQATPPSEKQIATYEKLLRVPTPIFDLWRAFDRRGGPESASVARFVGKDADIEVKKLQERFNKQSRTAVWRRMAWGLLPRRMYNFRGSCLPTRCFTASRICLWHSFCSEVTFCRPFPYF